MSAPKILITTPVYGAPDSASVSVAYHEALLSMAQSGQIQLTRICNGSARTWCACAVERCGFFLRKQTVLTSILGR